MKKKLRLIVKQFCEAAKALCKDNSDYIRVLEVDYWNHLRNVCLRGMKNDLSTLLVDTLREELDVIDLRLRVLTRIKIMLCDVNRDFSLCANHLKGHRELFCY